MKRSALILLSGLFLGTAAFAGFYYAGTASCRSILRSPQPELAWLKQEFKLSDAEFARIVQLHEQYQPQCAARCRRIEEQNQKLRQLFTQATNMTSQIQDLIAERASTRAECEAEMMKHFIAVSQTMPPQQGRRYLAWVEKQTFLHGSGMEEQHRSSTSDPHAGHKHSL